MRRQGHYGGDSGGAGHPTYGGAGAGAGAQSHQQQQNSKFGYYHGRHQDQGPPGEIEGRQQRQNQWRWERDGGQSKLPQTAMSPFTEGKGREAPRPYYQGQRSDSRIPLEKQGGGDARSQAHEEDMDIGYEDNRDHQTFEGLEQMFLDDIMKLSKEQFDAEDAENARHRERINVINEKYQEQVVALRAKHATLKQEFLHRESQSRKHQYEQIMMEQYPKSGTGHGDQQGYNAGTAAAEEQPSRAYNSEFNDSYRERGRFPGNTRDHSFEPKVPYPRGRSYDTGSRYY